ncbi:MAG TPA: DUF4157 domain-containing protein [Parafilimonas sp.]|nr:DUF4157 domain-containing protein [Parafilimonas sp.]
MLQPRTHITSTSGIKNTVNTGGVFFQPKLSVNKPNDLYEQEADAVADKVMRMSDAPVTQPPFFKPSNLSLSTGEGRGEAVQRKCAHCEEEEKQTQRKESNAAITNASHPENYINSISGGRPLGENERSFFEPRMGYDFSDVRIHADSSAANSARSINALAYTSGNNIVFNEGQFSPGTDDGKKLLAHELTHVMQQNSSSSENTIQRYSDTDHHILEEVALTDVFSEEELKKIEHGNMERDYSQLPSFGSGVLVGESDIGPYKAHEHFDNFIFDRDKNQWISHKEYDKIWDEHTKEWISRPVPLKPRAVPRETPLQYIESELTKAVEKDMPDTGSFTHVGNAFHTIEDFFAHSNFVELMKGDYTSGKELTTHPPGAPGAASTDSILSNELDPVPASVYKERFNKANEQGSVVSHGNMSKDFHSNPNQTLAMTLAALVIRQIGTMVKNVFGLRIKTQRNEYLKNVIMATVIRYLRPPDENDKWWEKLLEDDAGRAARKIKELQEKTPVTVNQLPGSPLRNLEATRFSSWKAIGLGTSISIPLKDRTFFTAGYMLYAPGTGVTPDDKILVAPRSEWDPADKPKIIFGAQISGTFDLTDLITKRRK